MGSLRDSGVFSFGGGVGVGVGSLGGTGVGSFGGCGVGSFGVIGVSCRGGTGVGSFDTAGETLFCGLEGATGGLARGGRAFVMKFEGGFFQGCFPGLSDIPGRGLLALTAREAGGKNLDGSLSIL